MSFYINVYKNRDLLLAYKVNIVIFLFLQLDCIHWHQDLYWIWLFLICITCGVLRQRNFHWELRFLTQAREIYGKSITILFRYKINQRQIQQMDPIAINTISNGQQLIFMGQTTLSAMQVVMVILHPMKIMTILSKHLLWVLYMSYIL